MEVMGLKKCSSKKSHIEEQNNSLRISKHTFILNPVPVLIFFLVPPLEKKNIYSVSANLPIISTILDFILNCILIF
jgi:hypothetical protein